MGLKSIVSALLPADYREQVLGDLHERGFRLRDIVSVVPRVWWSYLHRSSTLAGDSDEVLQRRLQRTEGAQRWGLLLWSAPLSARILFGPGHPPDQAVRIGIVTAILLVAVLYRPAQPRGREAILERHRYLLNWRYRTARFGTPYLFVALALIRSVKALSLLSPGGEQSFKFLVIAGAFAYGQLRASRLRKELEKLA